MEFDLFSVLEKAEKKVPLLTNAIGIRILNNMSPFNAHLKAKIIKWTKNETAIEIFCHRKIKNHIGGIHAGALFTLGETCAGLTLIKNFSFKKFRPIMSKVQVDFLKQARNRTIGIAQISERELSRVHEGLQKGLPEIITVESILSNTEGQRLAIVKTEWQIKAWEQIKTK